MRTAFRTFCLLPMLTASVVAQAPQFTFRGDYRIGHAPLLQSSASGAIGFVDAIAFSQAPAPLATPYGAFHLDPASSFTLFALATNGTAAVALPLPPVVDFVGLRIFGQTLAVPGLLSPVDDFVVGGFYEDLTERNATDWVAGAEDETSTWTLTEDPVRAVGQTSLRWNTTSGATTFVQFPATRRAGFDVTGNTDLEFFVAANNPHGFQGNQPIVRLGTGALSWFEYTPDQDYLSQIANTPGWLPLRVPLAGDTHWARTVHGTPSLQQVDWLEFTADTWDYGFTVWIDGVAFTPLGVARPFAPSAAETDVDVAYVERFPRYLRYSVDYDPITGVPSLTPGTASEKRWPDPNEAVTFRAHIKNAGLRDTGPLTVQWFVDGNLTATHTLATLAPGAQVTDDLPWSWQNGRHLVRCAARPSDGRRQVTLQNDVQEFATDALTYGFHMEQAAYDRLDAVPNLFGSRSAEDWLQAQLAWMNDMFVTSTYAPWATAGAMQRVRLDKLTIVPTGQWNGWPTDREVDGQWGYPAASLTEYENHKTRRDWALAHELSHQLGLIDLYQMNLDPTQNLVNGREYYQANGGLMAGGTIENHTGGVFYASHDVFGLNVTQGHRRGFYGEYLFAVPTSCIAAITEAGVPVANATVRFYQKDPNTSLVDAVPEFTGTTDALGRFPMPNRAVVGTTTATGLTLAPNPWGQIDVVGRNGLFLVEVVTPAGSRWGFLPLWLANVEWARGHHVSCVLDVAVTG